MGARRHHLVACGAAVVLVVVVAAVVSIRGAGSTPVDASGVGPAMTTTTRSVGSASLSGSDDGVGGGAADPADSTGATQESCSVAMDPLLGRACTIYRPAGGALGERLPVVVLLHGYLADPAAQVAMGSWTKAVSERRLVLVAPAGEGRSWNAGACCGTARDRGVEDDAYLAALVGRVRSRPDVDPDRVYMVGHSNGGMMTYRFLCDHADLLAGAASVAGTDVAGCAPSAPLRLLHVHALDDEVVPYAGGASPGSALLGVELPAVASSVEAKAAEMGCSTRPTDSRDRGRVVRTWSGCASGAAVRLVSLEGGGHGWPIGPAFQATPEILAFFGLTR